MGYPYSDDEIALEPFFNDRVSEVDGLKKNIRVTNPVEVVSGYEASDQEDLGNGTLYFGFMDKDSNWYIMQQVTTGTITTYRYFKGTTGYIAAWAGRVALVYDYFGNIF